MKKAIIILLSAICSLQIYSQESSTLWEGHFSYLNIKDIAQGNGKIYAAAENAIFIYDPLTFEIETISTIEGLSGEFITTIHYSENYGIILIGYENGLIDIYIEEEKEVLAVVDIFEKLTIPPDRKRINHFNEYNEVVYISTNFGISVYDLTRLEFGDTYYIGDGGSQTGVKQTAIYNNDIYAACLDNSGVRKALVTSNNLIDYQEWSVIYTGNYEAVEFIGTRLYAVGTNRSIYDISSGGALTPLFNYPSLVVDVKSIDSNLVITTVNQTYIYDENFNLLLSLDDAGFDTNFTSGLVQDGFVYIGSTGFGVLSRDVLNAGEYIEFHPDGPLHNVPFSIQAEYDRLWVTFGNYDGNYNPYPLDSYGISYLKDEIWNNIPFDSVLGARELNDIVTNPINPEQVFIGSFIDGLLELNNAESTKLYNETNSALESLILPGNPNYIDIRVSGLKFDRNGVLWTMTSRAYNPLKSFNPASNQWNSYDFSDIITNALDDDLGFSEIVIDNNQFKFVGSWNNGLIGFNDANGSIKNISEESNPELPTNSIWSLAIDKRNQLWIGTTKGLRVLYNTSNFFEDEEVQTYPIIILEDGIPKELLEQQYISDITVDGGNNKWIGTVGAGVFYLSNDGQETIYHFTKANSPLPSNNISDISVDSDNGIVYFATEKGLVSFRAGGSSPKDDLAEAYIYPNPVRPEFDADTKKIKIKDISDNVNIKITDIEGNLVAEAESRNNLRYRGFNLEIDGGTAYWNGKNLAGNKVHSGVYLVMLNDLDSLETRVLKLMVIR